MNRNHKNNSGKLMMILLILITLAISGSAGFYIYRNFYADQGPDVQMANIHLKEEIIAFVYQSMPEIYSSLSRINHELVLIAEEIKRLDLLEKEYPKQKKIVMNEKKNVGNASEKSSGSDWKSGK
jgi:hypothetical protein